MKKVLQSYNSTLRKRSPKMEIQKDAEEVLTREMLEECAYRCQYCGNTRTLGKHEIVFRSLGGNPLDKANCIILCWLKMDKSGYLVMGCHQLAQRGKISKEVLFAIKNRTVMDLEHGIREV